MKDKINVLTVTLVLITIFLIGASVFVVYKIRKVEKIPTLETEASKETYRKIITFKKKAATGVGEEAITPTEAQIAQALTPTPTLALTPTAAVDEASPTPGVGEEGGEDSQPTPIEQDSVGDPTPTEIDVVTTPIVTTQPEDETPTPTESENGEGENLTETPTPDSAIQSLPESGIFDRTLIIVAGATALIILSFIL